MKKDQNIKTYYKHNNLLPNRLYKNTKAYRKSMKSTNKLHKKS